jgi:photosynthetic reaction center cytochrome c subunit
VSAAAAASDVPKPPYDPPAATGPRTASLYKNVRVLTDVSDEQFNYTMAAITNWVAPEAGCAYCHNPADMSSDEKYTKVVARRMLQMTRAINETQTRHVAQTGVTCWTCHRGQAVPTEHWTLPDDSARQGIVGNRHGQDDPTSNSSFSSLPKAAVVNYLLGDTGQVSARVVSKTSHPTPANSVKVMDAENTYAMMMHISRALGVNCTYCHNAQSFQNWSTSNPPRATAFYGLAMVRTINGQYLGPLSTVFPANRKGPLGDTFKANCTTCHRGQNKPLGGYPMAREYPALTMGSYSAGVTPASAPVAAMPATAPMKK